MACLTENSSIHMRPVIKIGVVRQYVNAFPLQRVPGGVDGRKLFDILAVCLSYLVAIHAFFDGRNSRVTRFECSGMAIKTRDFENSGVQLMGIGEGLRRPISANQPIRFGDPSNAQNGRQYCQKSNGKDEF